MVLKKCFIDDCIDTGLFYYITTALSVLSVDRGGDVVCEGVSECVFLPFILHLKQKQKQNLKIITEY